MPASQSPQLAAAKAWLSSFEHLDGEANIALRTSDCIHVMAPSTLNYPPEGLTNKAWSSHLDTLKPILSRFPVVAKEIFESDSHITVWATSEAVFKDEVKDDDDSVDWTYHGEYVFIFTFNEQGDKIKRIVEFLDSKKVDVVWSLMQRAKKNLAARENSTM